MPYDDLNEILDGIGALAARNAVEYLAEYRDAGLFAAHTMYGECNCLFDYFGHVAG
jgi:hypothetical protein